MFPTNVLNKNSYFGQVDIWRTAMASKLKLKKEQKLSPFELLGKQILWRRGHRRRLGAPPELGRQRGRVWRRAVGKVGKNFAASSLPPNKLECFHLETSQFMLACCFCQMNFTAASVQVFVAKSDYMITILDQLSIYTSMKHSLIWPLKNKCLCFTLETPCLTLK